MYRSGDHSCIDCGFYWQHWVFPQLPLSGKIAEGAVGQEGGDGLGNLTNHILWDPGTFVSPLAAIVHPAADICFPALLA